MDTKQESIPRHIAIIMDGNGRWAKKKGLPRIAGHMQGTKTVYKIIEVCVELKIKALTLYTFSTENWKRPKEEVDALMKILKDQIQAELPRMQKANIRFNTIGEASGLYPDVIEKIKSVKGQTRKNNGLILTLALNYGSRKEITSAAIKIAQDVKSGKITPKDITEDLFDSYLYTRGLPELDLLIRTSGEMRLSNFLLWQLSYSEIYVTKKMWPEFTKEDFKSALNDFSLRCRRFGG